MATTIIIKNSSVVGKVPDASAIQPGELAINLVDQKLYSKDTGGNVFELGGSGNVGQGPTPPPSGNEIGDLWWDGDFLLVWNGSDWEVVGGVTSVNGETGDVVLKLGDLNDVELGLAGPSIGDIIAWDGNNWVSTAAPPADISGSSINDLNDVDTTGVNDGDILVWNDSAGEWQSTNRGTVPENTSDLVNDGENGTDPFITEADVNNILDGTTGGDAYLKEGDNISLLNNDAGYITDAGVTKIIAGDSIEVTPADGTGEVKIDVAIDASGVVINLDDLDDVNVPTPDDGDVLAWNGSEWVSAAAPPADISGSSINQLNDVDASGAADGDMLIWDGTNWVNAPAPTKTSDLTNDGENGSDPFITEGEVTNILNGLNPDGTPDAGNPGYLKPGDNVSELNNDANYITDTDTAADSNKLCGEDCSYYLDYQNFINTPEIPDPGDLELTAELGFSAEPNVDVEWGTTIRAIPTVIGGVQPVRLTYQWWNDFGAIISDTAIPGATNATYEIPETKVGYSIWCRVKATDAEGTEVEAQTNKCTVINKVVSAELWTEDSGKLYPTTLTNDVQVGGTSAAPNISLNASDGSALFKGEVKSPAGFSSRVDTSSGLPGPTKSGMFLSDSTLRISTSSGSPGSHALLALNSTTLNDEVVRIAADGSATFAGGLFEIKDTGRLIARSVGSSQFSPRLPNDGSTAFLIDTADNDGSNTKTKFVIVKDGTVYLGDQLQSSDYATTQKITLEPKTGRVTALHFDLEALPPLP